MATKFLAQQTVVGDPDVDRALLSVKLSKLSSSIPEVDESTVSERTGHIIGTNKESDVKIKNIKSKFEVPATFANPNDSGRDIVRERKSFKVLTDHKNKAESFSETQQTISKPSQPVSKIPMPNSPTRRQSVPGKPSKHDSRRREFVPFTEYDIN